MELLGTEIEGLADYICARKATSAADEMLVTSTVRDLGARSGIDFTDRRSQTLRGVPGRWELFVARSRSNHERD